MNIIVTKENPPIPSRLFDYSATFDGYEPGEPIGWGATPEEAIADLKEWQEALDLCDNTKEMEVPNV